jgi:TctA family transporter
MEVPLRTLVAVLLAMLELNTLTPGAKISTKEPKLEKEARMSVLASMAPTVMTFAADAGEELAASTWGFMLASCDEV